ncbi:hypothetical protein CU633_11315 [Bacillus sp. V3-13]|uniref:hypothetical protein n=1 Tax=Bacillus sp. V3-13 TaxID=2053728 RepID=UPI000C783474|nr:hypothetical protein [Bacillus sp. V3-13]PLR77349.1 hypothetical protein CU633_11315 [Bacillus sp. V3-13]
MKQRGINYPFRVRGQESRSDQNESVNESQSTQSSQSSIGDSGNSDVDVNVNVNVDTMPIAIAILCQALANKQLTQREFESAVTNLVEITDKYREIQKDPESKVKLFNRSIWRR